MGQRQRQTGRLTDGLADGRADGRTDVLSYFAGSGNILELLILKLVAGGQPRKVSKLGLSNILK